MRRRRKCDGMEIDKVQYLLLPYSRIPNHILPSASLSGGGGDGLPPARLARALRPTGVKPAKLDQPDLAAGSTSRSWSEMSVTGSMEPKTIQVSTLPPWCDVMTFGDTLRSPIPLDDQAKENDEKTVCCARDTSSSNETHSTQPLPQLIESGPR